MKKGIKYYNLVNLLLYLSSFNVDTKSEISIMSDLSVKAKYVLSICSQFTKTLLGLNTQYYCICYNSKSYFIKFQSFIRLTKNSLFFNYTRRS